MDHRPLKRVSGLSLPLAPPPPLLPAPVLLVADACLHVSGGRGRGLWRIAVLSLSLPSLLALYPAPPLALRGLLSDVAAPA